MIINELKHLLESKLPFFPTQSQGIALELLSQFLTSQDCSSAFILTGYAGTGKTSLLAALVETMKDLQMDFVLMAPTGRAAKVLSLYAGDEAHTIHRLIYRQQSLSESFNLGFNGRRQTLFVVDEASMISNSNYLPTPFGSGCLLDDLVQFIYGGQGCRLLLVGDTAQLPPVGSDESPALCVPILEGYGLNVGHYELDEVVRQKQESGVLWNATQLRRIIQKGEAVGLPKISLEGFPDLHLCPGNELIEALEDSYYKAGHDGTIIITRSNKRAVLYNNGVRNRILEREDLLCSGDRVMIAKNNYYWTEQEQLAWLEAKKQGRADENDRPPMDFIANGEMAEVRRVRRVQDVYGFTFAEVTLRFPDYDNYEMTCTAILDCLQAESPALTPEQQKKLQLAVWEDYADVPQKRERMKKLREDSFYNALQLKYAYAVTCHKAQGGQWERVFLDQGYMTDEMLTPEYFRWLYTAFTRTTEELYLVNWPEQQIKDDACTNQVTDLDKW